MHVHVIAVPYDSGRRGERMGAGPEHLLRSGLPERLGDADHDVRVSIIELPDGQWPAEVGSAFALATQVAHAVRTSRETGELPLVLSGNCGPAAIGCVAGLGAPVEVWWFDAHGDLNTPETSGSGFVDGMALATVTGRCWTRIASSVPGFTPVDDRAVVLVGARDLDPPESALLEGSGIGSVAAGDLRARLDGVLTDMRAGAAAYVHVDLDVLDAAHARANLFAAAGGLTPAELGWAIETIGGARRVEAAAITAYDPEADGSGAATEAAMQVAVQLVRSAKRAAE